MLKAWEYGTCSKSELLKKIIFFLQKWQFLPAEGRLPRYNIYMKIISIAQTLAVWQVDRTQKIGKFSSFWEPGFQKFIPPKLIFLVDLKYVIWFCLAFWETGESTHISSGSEDFFFSIFWKFKPYDRRGRSSFKISHIPRLEHIPMEHLWEKSRQIYCKTKKNLILRSPREKKQY